MKTPITNFTSFDPDRRSFIKTASLGAMAMSFPLPFISDNLKDVPMGVVVHSYGARWQSKAGSQKYPAFADAIDMMEHCKTIGAGGVQVLVSGWADDFAKKVRDRREKLDLYLEGSIGLPKTPEDVSKFESEVLASKEAGATVLRTACLSGRRYVNFQTPEEYKTFKENALKSIQLAEPIVRKHKMKLAVENHKDWTAAELKEIIIDLGSEWVGVTLDFGNNVSFLEDPMEVIMTLAPYSFSTHVKDMGVKDYKDGFLLSEVLLGEGIVDVKAGVDLCKKYNPEITFSLEMITRDPLEIPYLTDGYWATFENASAQETAKVLRLIKEKTFAGELPHVTGLSPEEKLAYEEQNVVACLDYSQSSLGL